MKRMGKQTHFSIEQTDKQLWDKQTDKDRPLLYRWIIKNGLRIECLAEAGESFLS